MNSSSRTLFFRTLSFLSVVAIVPLFSHAVHQARRPDLFISIPHLQLARNERVVGFDIRLASGRIAALPNVPIGWNVSVDNDASWNTEMEASTTIGAAALRPDFFHKFVLVEKHASPGVRFQLSGEVVVTEDFANERHIRLSMKDFETNECAAQDSRTCR